MRYVYGLIIALLIVGAAAGAANATILTFNFIPIIPNFGDIPTSYGDNVDFGAALAGCRPEVTVPPRMGCYERGSAWTPNVIVDYRTRAVGGPQPGETLFNNLDFWDVQYGNLVNVAYPVNPVSTGEISFIAAPGFNVSLNSFDVAGWPCVNHLSQPLRFLDGAYNVLLDLTPQIFLGAGCTVHSSYAPMLVGPIIRIQFGDNWNVGIDNINFTQVPAVPQVPEPSTLVLFATGFAGLLATRRVRPKMVRRMA